MAVEEILSVADEYAYKPHLSTDRNIAMVQNAT